MKRFRLRRAARWRLLRRRVFDWQSILIAIGGISIWWLLPNDVTNISAIPRLQKPMVSFVTQNVGNQQLLRSPTIFALPSIYGFGAIDDTSGMPDVNDIWYNSSPHYLARDLDGNNDSKIADLLSFTTDRQSKIYINRRVTAVGEAIFADDLNSERKINIVPHGKLREYKFEMPEIDIKSFDVDKSWIIRLLVEMSEKGYPVQVFIEKGSNIPDVDAKIIRMVNQSRLNEPGKSCEGRVTINFGL